HAIPRVPQITAQIGWAGRIRTFECQVQSLVPYQLGDRPAHFDSKAQAPARLPIRQLKLTAGETPCGRSAGEYRPIQSIRTEPPRYRTAQLSRRTNLPGLRL